MKIEVLCPSCGSGYLVDETDIPVTGGEVPCAGCGSMIPVSPETVLAAGRPVPEQSSARPLDRRRTPRKEGGDPAGSSEGGKDRVVCPRCGLHFTPRKDRTVAEKSVRPVVMVVEDMEYFLAIASDALEEKYEVRTARTVDEAFQVLNRERIDLMVLDLTLDGGEHGKRILEALQPKPCPIIIFTAEDEADMYGDRWETLQAMGADDLVLKGMNVGETLARKVAALLGEEYDADDMTG